MNNIEITRAAKSAYEQKYIQMPEGVTAYCMSHKYIVRTLWLRQRVVRAVNLKLLQHCADFSHNMPRTIMNYYNTLYI